MGKGLVLGNVLDVPWHNLEMMNKRNWNRITSCFVVWLANVPDQPHNLEAMRTTGPYTLTTPSSRLQYRNSSY